MCDLVCVCVCVCVWLGCVRAYVCLFVKELLLLIIIFKYRFQAKPFVRHDVCPKLA